MTTRPLTKDPENEVAMLSAPLYKSIGLWNGCWSSRSLVQDNEGVHRLAGSECVLLGHLRLTEGWRTVETCPDRYTIPVMVSMKNKGRTLFAVGAKHVQLCAVMNILQEDTWISLPQVLQLWLSTLPPTRNVLSSLKITESRNLSSSYILRNICIQNSLRTISSASVRCWAMDSLYAFRNTSHTVIFAIPGSRDASRVEFCGLRTKLFHCSIHKKHVSDRVTWHGTQNIRS
jgi:hypothetical protein